jgi:hypothetical protein
LVLRCRADVHAFLLPRDRCVLCSQVVCRCETWHPGC